MRNKLSMGKYGGIFLTMFRSYWVIVFAFGIAVGWLPPYPNCAWAEEQDKSTSEQIYIPAPPFGLSEETNKGDNLTQPCQKGEDDRNSDLCAQWKAADAATESADWARNNFWLDIVGAVIGFFTLVAAMAAAWYAKEAAAHTEDGALQAKRAADASHTANNLAIQSLLNADRPWLFIETLAINANEWRTGQEWLEWAFCFRNHGRGPAVVESIRFGVVVSDKIPIEGETPYNRKDGSQFAELCTPFHIREQGKRLVVPADGQTEPYIDHIVRYPLNDPKMSDEQRQRNQRISDLTIDGVLSVWLLGSVDYKDAFGTSHKTAFCLRYDFRNRHEREEGGKDYNYRT